MGYIRHHAIIVTTFSRELIARAHEEATKVFGPTLPAPVESEINGYFSFLVPPDGSKEGWADSDLGDVRRDKLIAWLQSQRYEDGSSPYDWVEVQYGDDDGETRIVRDSDESARKEEAGEP